VRSYLAGVLALAAASAACGGGPSAFACKSSDECRLDSVVGTCQPDGWCSFPDEACSSGERYGTHAGDGNAGVCVVADDGGTGTPPGSTMPGSTMDGSASDGLGTGGDPSSSSGGSLTLGVASSSGADTSEGGQSSDSTSSDPGDSSSSSDGPEPLPCDLDEEFLGAALDDTVWGSWEENGATIVVEDGLLSVALPAGVVAVAGIQTAAGDLHGRAITMVIGAGPNPATTAEQALILNDSGGDFRITITEGEVFVSVYDGTYEVLAAEPIDTSIHDHLRVGEQGDVMFVERSAGPDAWETLWEGPHPIEISDVTLTARVQTWEPVMSPGTPSYDAIRICPLP
jgi:hypothetical protein